MARVDAIVLGAGIVGTSIGLQLAKRGLAVALVDRRPGRGDLLRQCRGDRRQHPLPPAPSDPLALLRVALKRAGSHYHLTFLPQVAPWLIAFRAASTPQRLMETARAMRPLFASRAPSTRRCSPRLERADTCARKAGSSSTAVTVPSCAQGRVRARPGIRHCSPRAGPGCDARARAQPGAGFPPCRPLAGRRQHHQPAGSDAGLRRAFRRARRRCGARRCPLAAPGRWALAGGHGEGPLDAAQVVVALGLFAPDVLAPSASGCRSGSSALSPPLPAGGNAALSRPVVDIQNGYCLAPMEQGIRLMTGPSSRRVTRRRRRCSWTGCCRRRSACSRSVSRWRRHLDGQPAVLPRSRPVIGRAPGQDGLWLAYGHAHWGLTLGLATGRLVAEMMTGATPFCDPALRGRCSRSRAAPSGGRRAEA